MNDTTYRLTGGTYAKCPDHDLPYLWLAARGMFKCSEGCDLAPADIYLEHDESWRTVNDRLWIDTYEEEETPTCEWFALCDRAATGTLSHPFLGDVPVCDRCRVLAERP